jgi:hypothetical protein
LDGVRDVANLAPEGEPRRVRDDLNAVAASAGAVGRQQAAPSQIALA